MTHWTDYPIERLGDTPGEEAPVRPCEIVGYDGDKYLTIRVGGVDESVKRGYVYVGEGRYGEHPAVTHRDALRWAGSTVSA